MDKETFSNYGWIIVTVIIVGLVIAMASPLGNYIVSSITNLVNNFSNSANSALESAGNTSYSFVPVLPTTTAVPAAG